MAPVRDLPTNLSNEARPLGAKHSTPSSRNQSRPRTSSGQKSAETPLFPVPIGCLGRSASAGFNFEKKMLNEYDWTKEFLEIVKTYVHRVAQRTLDLGKLYQQQDSRRLKKVCNKASARFGLHLYEDFWPVRCILRLYLKKISKSLRRNAGKDEGGRFECSEVISI
ncbi:hypothetical protein B0H16DRAFT_1480015 [Mycena metata]|uniref:Uncharacterized protein n=1 Tax=Mycena metata TaxID=1033252 RepID=A0AAD7H427_9AGAR|nr:hypothetical protein B0H16DRAFT_1480015 [Mycena metata]